MCYGDCMVSLQTSLRPSWLPSSIADCLRWVSGIDPYISISLNIHELPDSRSLTCILISIYARACHVISPLSPVLYYFSTFQNNLTTSLIWIVGFSANFVIGNLLYILLLVYCTNESKAKHLRTRWALESIFNVAKDLYYIWIGAALLDHVIILKSQ